jgi:hypothetical protein
LGCVSWATWQRGKYIALLHKGTAAPDCTPSICSPVNFTVLKPSNWTRGYVISIRIDKKDLDRGTHESSSDQVFHNFYEEMRSEFSFCTKAKNLFLSLAESIAQTLNVTSCYVEGPTWETLALGSQGAGPTGAF